MNYLQGMVDILDNRFHIAHINNFQRGNREVNIDSNLEDN